MSSDVGASRIWNRLLDAAFDNSDRRKHGMGAVGRAANARRPGANLRRSGGGNSGSSSSTSMCGRPRKNVGGMGNALDHRPYFTYWVSAVQTIVLVAAMLAYGVGPIGVDLYKKAGMVRNGRS